MDNKSQEKATSVQKEKKHTHTGALCLLSLLEVIFHWTCFIIRHRQSDSAEQQVSLDSHLNLKNQSLLFQEAVIFHSNGF